MATATTIGLTVEDIRRRLAPLFERPDVDLVVLFGSRAAGTHRAESDIDLGISADTEQRDLVLRLLAPATVDTFNLRACRPDIFEAVLPDGILEALLPDGILLYERSPGRLARFLRSVMRDA